MPCLLLLLLLLLSGVGSEQQDEEVSRKVHKGRMQRTLDEYAARVNEADSTLECTWAQFEAEKALLIKGNDIDAACRKVRACMWTGVEYLENLLEEEQAARADVSHC